MAWFSGSGKHRETESRRLPPLPSKTRPRSRELVIGTGLDWSARWVLRWVALGLGAYLIAWTIGKTWSIVLPIVLALILTTILQPPARWLQQRARLPGGIAALVVIVTGLGLVTGIAVLLAPTVSSQAIEVADSTSIGLDRIREWVANSRLDVTQAQVDSVVTAAQDRLRAGASEIATGVLVGVSAVTSALITFLLTLVLSFFFIKDGHRFLPWLAGLTGAKVGGHLSEVGSRAWDTLGGFVRTQALVGLIDAVLIGAGLLVLGVPLALPLAVLTFFAAFAPVIGAVAIGGLAVLVALVANGPATALGVLAIVLVVQQLEGNVFLPWLQGRSLNLHAGVVLLSITLGSTLFGIAGAFLSVPFVAVAAVVLRYVDERVDDQVDGEVETKGTVGRPADH